MDPQYVIEWLENDTRGKIGYNIWKPKAINEILVSELREELEEQGCHIEGNKSMLF